MYFRSWWILGHYTHTYSSLPLAICEAARTSWHLFSRPFFHKLQAHNAPSIRTHISTLTSNPWHCWVGTQLDIWDAALPSLVCVYGCRPKTFILISSCVCHGPTWMVKAASTCFCIFQVHNDASVGKQQASSITYQPLKWEPPSVKCNRTTRANTVFYGCLKDVALTGNFWNSGNALWTFCISCMSVLSLRYLLLFVHKFSPSHSSLELMGFPSLLRQPKRPTPLKTAGREMGIDDMLQTYLDNQYLSYNIPRIAATILKMSIVVLSPPFPHLIKTLTSLYSPQIQLCCSPSGEITGQKWRQ